MLIRKKTSRFAGKMLTILVVIAVAFTATHPSILMDFFISIGLFDNSQQYVNPLASDSNSVYAMPSTETLGSGSMDKTDGTAYDPAGSVPVKEIPELRDSHTNVYLNKNGSKTMEVSSAQQNYLDGSIWKKIDNTITAESKNVSVRDVLGYGSVKTAAKYGYMPAVLAANSKNVVLKGSAGLMTVEFGSTGEGIVVTIGDKTITMRPETTKVVNPEQIDERTVIYAEAWPNVDLQYELRGESVKEIVVIKNKDAQNEFNFSVDGGRIIQHPLRAGELAIDGISEEFSFSALTLSLYDQGVISETRVTQTPTDTGISLKMDAEWVKAQSDTSFPMRIDPTLTRQGDWSYNYIMAKSDGYQCNATNCYIQTGTVYHGGWKHWRTLFHFNYTQLQGKVLQYASLHGHFQPGVGGVTSTWDTTLNHAVCLSYGCVGEHAGYDGAVIGDFLMDFTGKLNDLMRVGDYGGWWILRGAEVPATTYKTYYDMTVTMVYDTPTPMTQSSAPADKSVVITTQPTLKVNPVSDADGDAVKYYFRVTTNPDAETGMVVNSGWIENNQWTVPANVLQDGKTYYWHTYTGGGTQTNPNWVRSFTVNMRKGKDSTQAYEDLGLVGVDLATGNATSAINSHVMSALGGDIGINLTYNSPAMGIPGLQVKYWNNSTLSGVPTLERVESGINFNWGTGTPANGVVADYYSASFSGYITVPTTGDYIFGCHVDDRCRIYFNDQLYYDGPIGLNYSSNSIRLEEGMPTKIRVEFEEYTSAAYMQLYVKGAVNEQIVPDTWFNTGARPSLEQYGLTGWYYGDSSSTRTFNQNQLLMVRNDSKLTFNWQDTAPAKGLPLDNFLVRWKGYLTVPTSGSYSVGATGDDGIRVKLGTGVNGADETVIDSWAPATGTNLWGTAKNLTAGQPVPITIELYEAAGFASFNLLIRGSGLGEQEMPVTWLSPNDNVVPSGWNLGLSGTGASFERLELSSSAAVLSDNTGQRYEFKWENGSYKSPKELEASLIKNDDNTYTLYGTNGVTYIFNVEGSLISAVSPADDRQPVALRYEYSGSPAKLTKIIDGVTAERYGTIHYAGDTQCSIVSGFDSTPNGMLCAFTTTDGNRTTFQYKNGNLARIIYPGNIYEDFSYDSFQRITNYRGALANEVIASGQRNDDETVLNTVEYDEIGRVEAVKSPSSAAGSNRLEVTLNYYSDRTEMHLTGASEPHGFSRKVTYDNLLRTTSLTDLTNQTVYTEWHPDKDLILSSTDVAGLKSTIIYDENDNPIEAYGAAPADWFGSDRKPLTAHIDQVPHTSTKYDEGILGFGVAYYNNKKLIYEPKLHDTVTWLPNENVSVSILDSDKPVEASDGWSARYTGKIQLNELGDHRFKLTGDGGFRLYINDELYIDAWGDNALGGNIQTVTSAKALSNTNAGSYYRIRIDQYHASGSDASLQLSLIKPGNTETSQISEWLTPNYNLKTSSTVYDSILGNSESEIVYSEPEYGLVEKTILDPDGLNYENTVTYEELGAGLLRQTSKSLPGDNTTTYEYYSGSDTMDNPCTTETEIYRQAGRIRLRNEMDPDGAGPETGRTTETIYNETGMTVASRYNNDAWTCTEYDARGRVTKVTVPPINNKPGRVMINAFAVNGNPLINASSDVEGTITTEIDLLGRAVSYTDAKGNTTTSEYNDLGKLVERTSIIGVEEYIYDQYDRIVEYALDGTTYATVTYDAHNRIHSVQYPDGLSLEPAVRDDLQRVVKATYNVNGQEIYDQINTSTSGIILGGEENGITKSYAYDKSGRLLSAEIGEDEFSYEFGEQDASCQNLGSVINPNAAKNSNRTKLIKNGETTTYCYDFADRLINSSDARFSSVIYDTHGNTISMGETGSLTEFSYDVSDRNTKITETTTQKTTEISYARDVSNRIISRQAKEDSTVTAQEIYAYITAGSSHNAILDANNQLQKIFLTLPGGVTVTISPTKQTIDPDKTVYSLSNTHGDNMATLNANLEITGIYLTGPFGETLEQTISSQNNPSSSISGATPNNSTSGTSFGYVGKHLKVTESSLITGIIQMGARVYIPELGRFIQVDPVEGGTLNPYVYAMDPVNQWDLSGKSASMVVAVAMTLILTLAAAVKASSIVGEVTGRPSAAGGYTHWIAGSGEPMKIITNKVNWKITGFANFKPEHCQDCIEVTSTALGFDGYMHIGNVNGEFVGDLEPTDGKLRLRGWFTPYTDGYNFNDRTKDELPSKIANMVGRISGLPFKPLGGAVDYEVQFIGKVYIDQIL